MGDMSNYDALDLTELCIDTLTISGSTSLKGLTTFLGDLATGSSIALFPINLFLSLLNTLFYLASSILLLFFIKLNLLRLFSLLFLMILEKFILFYWLDSFG